MGIDPYPAETYDINVTTAEILDQYPDDDSLFQDISIAGRIHITRRSCNNI